jgi:hypothetical protein
MEIWIRQTSTGSYYSVREGWIQQAGAATCFAKAHDAVTVAVEHGLDNVELQFRLSGSQQEFRIPILRTNEEQNGYLQAE